MSSLYEQFKQAAQTYPRNLAIRFENQTLSYRKVNKKIKKEARRLATLGVKAGSVVSVSLPNCPEAVYLLYAISYLGAISYNIHPMTPAPMMKTLIERAHSDILLCLSLNANDYRKTLPTSVKVVAINPYYGVNPIKAWVVKRRSNYRKDVVRMSKIKPAKRVAVFPSHDEDDAIYLNTGGTNGEPKIVRLSNRAINYMGSQTPYLVTDDLPLLDMRMFAVIPMFHAFGLAMGIHIPLSIGSTTVLMLKFKTKACIKLIRKGQVNVILGVPAIFNALLSRDSFYGPWLKKQKVAFVGGDSIPQSLLDRWNEAMEKAGADGRLYEGYGLTETSSACNINYFKANKRGTIGKPLVGVSQMIIDLESKEPLPPNTLGEICVSGPTVMTGYLDSDDLNATCFIEKDGKKYFCTQDYGSIDEEGYITFRQRLRRIVKINAETLCPSDVEDCVMHLADVFECYCYGIPDERKGHVFALAVVTRKGDHERDEAYVEKEIRDYIAKNLPPSHMPKVITFYTKLPRTAVGKVDAAYFDK